MHHFETKIQELKTAVMTEVARLTWEDKLDNGVALLDIPEKIIPGPNATLRCCIYKERAIIGSRVKMAMGGDKVNPSIVEVLPIACDECPVTEITVGPSCRGCLATRCVNACPKDAIEIVNHRAQINHDKCISCGRCITACQYSAIIKTQRPCEKGCPAKAISMGPDKKASIDVNECISCGTCVNQCPFGAIQDKSFITDAIHLLKGGQQWGYNTYAAVAPSIAGQFSPATFEQVVTGLKMLGFHGVTEVAMGADMVADQESDELLEKGLLTSSCCPGFVGYVKKKHPELEQYISHTPSPMVAIGLHIKEQEPNAKVIFIGPCIAKKREAQLGRTRNAIDCVLTYEELFSLFQSRDIDLEKLEESPLSEASPFARNFAYSGGVSAAVAQAMKEKGTDQEFDLKAVPCNGIAACEVALLKLKRGVFEGNFLEGMACEGGCVQGAGCLVRSPRNKMNVLDYSKKAEGRDILGALSNKAQIPADSTGEAVVSLPMTAAEKTPKKTEEPKKPEEPKKEAPAKKA